MSAKHQGKQKARVYVSIKEGQGKHYGIAAETQDLQRCAVTPNAKISFLAAAICVVLVAISLRPAIVSIGPLLPAIQLDFDLSYTLASMLITIPDLAMGALALPTPWLARRYGRNRVVLIALSILFVSIINRSLSPSVNALLLTTLGVGTGIAIAGTLIASFIKAHFPKKAALMMSVYAAALGFGSSMAAAISGPLAEYLGSWRTSSLSWALLCLVSIGAWLFIQRRERFSTAGHVKQPGRKLPINSQKAWLIALFFAFNNLIFYALLSWLVPMYLEWGMSIKETALLLTVLTSGCMAASIVVGFISRNDDRRGYLALSSIFVLAGVSLIVANTQISPYLSVAVTALGIGSGFSLGMTLPLDNSSDEEEAGSWTAFVLTVGYLIAATGPFAVGVLRDQSGSYSGAMLMLSGVAVATIILVPFLAPRQLP
jgi:CP family cyanate transporter-like MFS transporter